MSIFKKLKSAFSRAIPTKTELMTIPKDLQVLDRIEPSLARKAFEFTAAGKGSTVLSTLSQKQSGHLKPGGLSNPKHHPARARRQVFLASPNTGTDIVLRYVQVLAADDPNRRFHFDNSNSVFNPEWEKVCPW